MQKISDEEYKEYKKEMRRTQIIGYLEMASVLFVFFILIPFGIFYGLWLLLLPVTFWERVAYFLVAGITTMLVDALAIYAFLAWEGEI